MMLDELRGPECPVCGADMEHKRSTAIYCSARCRSAATHRLVAEARAEARQGKTCATCGVGFVAGRIDQLYCSKSCMDKAGRARRMAARPERPYVVCGGAFHPAGAAKEAKTCSRPCADALCRETWRAGAPEGRTCAVCGAPFVASRRDRMYCSRACVSRAHWARKVAVRPERPARR